MKLYINLFILFFISTVFAMEIPVDSSPVSQENASTGNIAYLDIEKVFNEHPMTKRMKEEFKADAETRKKEIQDMEASIGQLQKVIVSTTTEMIQLKTQLALLKNSKSAAANMQVGISTTAPDVLQGVIISSSPAEVPLSTSAISIVPPIIATSTPSVAISSSQPEAISNEAASAIVYEKFERDIKEKEDALNSFNAEISKKKDDIAQKIKQNREDLTKLEEKQTQKVLADIYRILENIARDNNLAIIVDKDNVLYGPPNQDVTEKVLDRLQGR